MFNVTINRSKIKKWPTIIGLFIGIGLCISILFTFRVESMDSLAYFFLFLYVFSPAIVAIKHIIMLTRA